MNNENQEGSISSECNWAEKGRCFPNLARRVPEIEGERVAVLKEVDDAVRRELMEAGVLNPDGKGDYGNYMEADGVRKYKNNYKEVPCSIFAAKYRWTFDRRWYYYSVKGPGIPPDIAEEFHWTWGNQVRVDGHCGCPSPLEWERGFAVGMYHIDTQVGLNEFVKMLASIYRPREVNL